jgi:putative transcriptional regulator
MNTQSKPKAKKGSRLLDAVKQTSADLGRKGSVKDQKMTTFEKDLLESIRQAKRGEGRVIKVAVTAATEARMKLGVSQSAFAKLLGVSVRTLQEWEQGRREPSGAARTLLRIALRSPEAILQVG